YFFARYTPGRNRMKAGDKICFYLKRRGVGAEAELGEPSSRVPYELEEFTAAKFMYPFRVRHARFLENPVVIDSNLRRRLDAFKGRGVVGWQWFVRQTRSLSRRDFLLLTGQDE